jgi:hypothetical protein
MCKVTEQESSVQSRMKSMLAKMKPNEIYPQGYIDVMGTTDAQAFARLCIEKKKNRIRAKYSNSKISH